MYDLLVMQYAKLAKFDDAEDLEQAYDITVCTLRKLGDKPSPLKAKIFVGNSAPFMTRELQKDI